MTTGNSLIDDNIKIIADIYYTTLYIDFQPINCNKYLKEQVIFRVKQEYAESSVKQIF